MKYLKMIWAWIMKHAVILIIICLACLYLVANTASIQVKMEIEKDILACKTICFPQQSEYITHGDAAACWCYIDQNTMNKAN